MQLIFTHTPTVHCITESKTLCSSNRFRNSLFKVMPCGENLTVSNVAMYKFL